VPKITDFGLAKHLEDNSGLTETGRVLGTPAYMAPEQAAGQSHRIGPHTDVYSLGAILYELLSGKPPFSAGSSADALFHVLAHDPIPLRPRQPSVPRDLETICLKCLEKEPARRYASALELAEELRRFQEGRPIRARPVGPAERLGKWARRHPVVAALAASLVLVTALGFAGVSAALLYALQGWSVAAEEKIKVEEEREVARTEHRLAREAQEKEAMERQCAHCARMQAESNLALGHLAQAGQMWRLNRLAASASRLALIEPEKRGWEWRYLDSLHRGELRLLARPAQFVVRGIAFSPDGKHLATGGGNPYMGPAPVNAEIALWETSTGRFVVALPESQWLTSRIAFSPSGQYLAAGGKDETVRVWAVSTGRLVRKLNLAGQPGTMGELAWSPDSKHLAAGAAGLVVTWEVDSGKVVRRWAPGDGVVRCLAWSSDGKHLAADGTRVKLYEIASGREIGERRHPAGAMAFRPDSRALAFADDSIVRVVTVPDLQHLTTLGGHAGQVSAVAYSPDGLLLASAGADTTVRIWNADDGRQLDVWRGHRGRVDSIAFHPSGWMVASGSSQPGDVRLWDLTRHQEHTCVAKASGGNRVDALAFTPDHQVILQRHRGDVEVRDPRTGLLRWVRQVPCFSPLLTPAVLGAISGDTKSLFGISCDDFRHVRAWEAGTGEPLPGSYRHGLPVWHIACNRDGQVAASVDFGLREGTPRSEQAVWSPRTGKVLWRQVESNVRVRALVLDPSGRWLARAVSDVRTVNLPAVRLALTPTSTRLEIWDVPAPGQPAPAAPWRTLRPGENEIHGLAFAAGGKLLASSARGGKVHLWELPSGRLLHGRALAAPVGLEVLAFSPDGKRLACASRTEVVVWDVTEGQEVLTVSGAPPRGSDQAFNPRVAWSADGRFLAASNWDHSVSVWDGSDLTKEENGKALREAALARRPGWHLRRAKAALAAGNRSAAEHQLREVDRLEPLAPGWCLRRGHLWARLGQWDRAALDHARAVGEHISDTASTWREHLLLQAKIGKREGRQVAERLVERFGRETSTTAMAHALHAALQVPGAVKDYNRVVHLLEQRRGRRHVQDSGWYRHVLALAYLRAGRHADAIRTAGAALKENHPSGRRHIVHWLTLALAHHHQGDREQARKWFEQARSSIASEEQKLAAGGQAVPDDVSWSDWLWMQQLRDEAGKTLGEGAD
jgi:WD40 repeat protein